MNSKQKELLIEELSLIKPDSVNIAKQAAMLIRKYEVTEEQKLDLRRIIRLLVTSKDCKDDYTLLGKTIEGLHDVDPIDPPINTYEVLLNAVSNGMHVYTDSDSTIPNGHYTHYYTNPMRIVVDATSPKQAAELAEYIVANDDELKEYDKEYIPEVVAVIQSLQFD